MAFKFNNNPRNYGISYTTVERNQKIPAHFATPTMQTKIQKSHEESIDDHGSLLVDINSSVKLSQFIRDETETETHQDASKERGSGFSGVSDIDEALDVLNNGEDGILEEIKSKSEEIIAENADLVPRPFGVQRDVEGNFFDVGLYLTGEPEAFYKENDQMVADKVVTVHIHACYNAGTSKDHVIRNLIYLLAAIRIMEMAGYSVGVNMYWLSRNTRDDSRRNISVRYRIKSPKEPLNLRRLVGTAHPAFFRRIIFRIQELTNTDPLGYGRALELFSDAFEIDKMKRDVRSIIKQAIGEEEIERKEEEGGFLGGLPF